MEYEDELDRMRNRKRRPAVRQTEIKKQTVSRRYAEPEKRQGTQKYQEMRLEYEDFSDARQANRSRKAVNSEAAGGSHMSGSSRAAGREKQENGQSKVHQMAAQNRKTRAQKKKRKQKVVAGILLIAALVIGLTLFFMKKKDDGYWTVAVFGVDSRDGELDKSTRTDTIIIASINQDTKEVKMISVLRDTYLNLSTDTYNKANSAYAKGGPKQAIAMLNMNLDMNITDFVTIGFDGLIDVIDAVGGIEIDVQENEIPHLNSYQISMVGKQDGTLNAKGEPNYVATEGVDYIPVTTAGLQKLNGLQATAYCRIRYVGNDFARTQRQRTVIEKVAKKAMTLNPATLNNIANAVFPKIATSLDLSEIIELLGGITGYTIGETASFPFDGSVQTGRVRKMSVVIPQDLEYNVKLLHQMFFDEQDYEPSSTVKTCSSKIASDTGVYYSGQ